MSRRRATAGFALLAVLIAGVVAVLIAAASTDSDLAFTPSVRATGIAEKFAYGDEACGRTQPAIASFERLRFPVGTLGGSGQRLEVSIFESPESTTLLARGRKPAKLKPAPFQPVVVSLDREVPKGAAFSVCVRNTGTHGIALFGSGGKGHRPKRINAHTSVPDADISFVFLKAHPASLLSQVPEVFRRASLFRPYWVGAWTFWLVGALLLLLVPALLVRAVMDTAETDPRERPEH
jgi:hypothetical protein